MYCASLPQPWSAMSRRAADLGVVLGVRDDALALLVAGGAGGRLAGEGGLLRGLLLLLRLGLLGRPQAPSRRWRCGARCATPTPPRDTSCRRWRRGPARRSGRRRRCRPRTRRVVGADEVVGLGVGEAGGAETDREDAGQDGSGDVTLRRAVTTSRKCCFRGPATRRRRKAGDKKGVVRRGLDLVRESCALGRGAAGGAAAGASTNASGAASCQTGRTAPRRGGVRARSGRGGRCVAVPAFIPCHEQTSRLPGVGARGAGVSGRRPVDGCARRE